MPEEVPSTSKYEVQESISMFFDKEFNPFTYIDQFVSQSTHNKTTTTTYSKTSLNKLSNNISSLITHLDYYSNELSNNQLKFKLDQLETSNQFVKSSDEQDKITRLQYNINLFNNSLIFLTNEMNDINQQLDMKEENNKVIKNLVSFKIAKQNLIKTLEIFEFINSILSNGTYTVDQFQNLLDEYLNEVEIQLNENIRNNKAERNQYLLDHLDKLIDLQDIFQGLTKFHPIFKKFINKLVVEKESIYN